VQERLAERKANKERGGGGSMRGEEAGEHGFSAATAEGASQLAEAFGSMLGEGPRPPPPDASGLPPAGGEEAPGYNPEATFDGGEEVREELACYVSQVQGEISNARALSVPVGNPNPNRTVTHC